MPAPPTVDREDEVKIFVELLEKARGGRSTVLTIEDASGRGKSRLLARFKEVCVEQGDACSNLDLKGGSHTPIELLSLIGLDIAPLVPTEKFRGVLNNRQLVNVSPGISDNKAIGSATYAVTTEIHVGSVTRDAQKQLWSDATQGFREDLRLYRTGTKPRAVVLVFDTFENANPDSQRWIIDQLLPSVAPNRVPGLLIVVGGKTCPKPTGEWEDSHETLTLPALKVEHWTEYGRIIGSSLTEDQIRRAYKKHDGLALKMAETVGTFT
jgi:hypothetical protein